MMATDLSKLQTVEIYCQADLDADIRKGIISNLSGAVLSHQGQYLWLGTDEFTSIERFTKTDDQKPIFSEHQRFQFKDFIDDFDEEEGEVDIEGLSYSEGYLWMIGSHSSKRKKVKIKPDKYTIGKKELKEIEREKNRYLLARIPINEQGELAYQSPQRAWLSRHGSSNALTQALAKDEYLDLAQIIADEEDSPPLGKEVYLYLPSKENGLDIEGLAVDGNKILVGLRGPVLRGIALLLALEVEDGSSHELYLKTMGNEGRVYKRHFLDLDGLGIRELCWQEQGSCLLILAGPTMDLDGALQLFRLHDPLALEDNSLSSQQNRQLEYLGTIPHGYKCDRAEGLCLYNDSKSILVVYDSPKSERLVLDATGSVVGVHADEFVISQS
jgi:hypothetical protein